MNIVHSTSQFLKNVKSGVIDYFKLTPRISRIIALEIFVFGTFISICVLINEVILKIPHSTDPGLNFLFASLKVGISFILIGLWLIIWYYLTKRLMKNDKKKVKEKEESN